MELVSSVRFVDYPVKEASSDWVGAGSRGWQLIRRMQIRSEIMGAGFVPDLGEFGFRWRLAFDLPFCAG